MWKPEQRIRWTPTLGSLPDAQQIASSRLFSPLQHGRLQLNNRSWVPAMVPWRATGDGEVTPQVLDWYGRFARGKPAAIVVEATGIRDVPSGPLLRIGHDRFLPGLRQLVERVKHDSGGHTRLFIQLIDFLAIKRRPDRERYLRRFLQITDQHRQRLAAAGDDESSIREQLLALTDEPLQAILSEREWQSLTMGHREHVNDTGLAHIAELPQVLPDLFSDAAQRAESAGFDGVELHYAHAYTMASFLSSTNQRDDGYGGSREARVRLPLEVFKQVRTRVPETFAVGARYLAEETTAGGTELPDSCYYGVQFAKAGMDFISLSRGGRFDDARQPKVGAAAYPYTGPSGYECMPQYISDTIGPFGRNLQATQAIKQALLAAGCETPVVAAGGIHNFEMAEQILLDGCADIIGAARQTLADPDWILKLQTGCGEQIRLCEYTNYCEGLDQNHKQVTCKLWDREQLDEPGVRLASDGKRRLVAPDWKASS